MKNEIRIIEHVCGIEYILEKKEKRKFIFSAIFIFSIYYMYYVYQTYKRGYLNVDEFQIFLFFVYISLILICLNNYYIEKLLIINNIGIQIEKISFFKHQFIFICVNDIKSTFINEAIYIFEISPYLCIFLKNNSLIVCFEDFNLEMKKLVNIYRSIREILFFTDYKKLSDINSSLVKNEAKILKNEEECLKNNDKYLTNNDTYLSGNDSNEENIFKLFNFGSNENTKINKKLNNSKKTPIYDVYINKKLALDIMNS